ncbi:MAG: hypothetical protein JSR09_03710 [Bacteroidetes bacterium]|nr:hypothetical protein [Bacteroidota bacterium]MBS1648790.1 hypothetical protein [Bacteroidota bacterium]
MYKVTNFLMFTIVTLFFSVSAKAQIVKLPKALLFGNFTYTNPQGDFANSVNNGTGFEVGGGLGLGKTLLYASTGYIKYSGNSDNLKVVPLKVGIRRYLLMGLFLNGAIGVATQSYDNRSVTNSSFLYEVGAGIKLLGIIELGAAYTGWQTQTLLIPSGTQSKPANALLLKAGVAIKL